MENLSICIHAYIIGTEAEAKQGSNIHVECIHCGHKWWASAARARIHLKVESGNLLQSAARFVECFCSLSYVVIKNYAAAIAALKAKYAEKDRTKNLA